ncbi:MAG: hypothetical protein Q4P15_09410 [Propionibacteriaceae bacterium]|nr:hypothetical protein [Propionibacteriaceae bacterium]
MTMTTKTLVRLAPVGALCLLAACGASPQDPVQESSPPAVTEPADPSDAPQTTTASESADTEASPSSEVSSSDEPAAADELPPTLQGKWVTFTKGETPRVCTDELDAEGAILTIDATTMSSFAFLFTLESIEESDDESLVGLFNYVDDGDQPATPRIKLETTDDWQSFELIELDTEFQVEEMYARCS